MSVGRRINRWTAGENRLAVKTGSGGPENLECKLALDASSLDSQYIVCMDQEKARGIQYKQTCASCVQPHALRSAIRDFAKLATSRVT